MLRVQRVRSRRGPVSAFEYVLIKDKTDNSIR